MEDSTRTQCRQVLHHLKTFGHINHMRAETDYGITRIAARINDLRNAGYPIRTEMVTRVNRYGKPVRYAKYVMDEDALLDKAMTDAEIHQRRSELFADHQEPW